MKCKTVHGNGIVNKVIILMAIIFLGIPDSILAQQSKVDSVLAILKECMPNDKLDSAKFQEAMFLLSETDLNNELVTTLEKGATLLDRGVDQDRSFRMKIWIWSNLNNSDYESSIQYGKKLLHEVEGSKAPHKRIIRDLILSFLRIPYRNSNQMEEGIQFFNSRLKDFKESSDSSGMATAHFVLSGFYSTAGLNDEAVYHLKKSNTYTNEDPEYDNTFFNARERNTLYYQIQNLGVISSEYYEKGDMEQALHYGMIAIEKAKKMGYSPQIPYLISHVAAVKLATNELKDIPELLNEGLDNPANVAMRVVLMLIEAEYYIKTKSFHQAESIIADCWRIVKENNVVVNSASGIINPDYSLALLRIEQNRINEAIELLDKDILRLGNLRQEKLKDYLLQVSLYEKQGDYRNAFLVNKKYVTLQQEIQLDIEKFRRVSFEVEQEMNQNELSIAALKSENKISSIIQKFTIGLAIMFIFLAAAIYYRFQSKKKANAILEATLSNLKSTQSQLIQSEKMASLGEMTAGIAHEIQNPLNFVNNFSEVSTELVEEMKAELATGNQQLATEIANDLKQNLEKINHHGKRAGDIMKGMLQHSRTGSGQKEPTDINALCDEYLRLAYHGFRAKDKSFNAKFETNFDSELPKVNVVPQEMGRVILNLINNAFYAVNEKAKRLPENYEPTVTVSTQTVSDKVIITVADNGDGIPAAIKDKIFQPFFTTKPTGQGTGLGLSLAYDIVTKGHDGTLNVESVSETGTKLIITLPA